MNCELLGIDTNSRNTALSVLRLSVPEIFKNHDCYPEAFLSLLCIEAVLAVP